MNANANLML